MKKKLMIAVVMAFIFCATAIGCTSAGSGDIEIIEASPSADTVQTTQDNEKGGESTLTVSATETVKVSPDIAYITIGVSTKGATAEKAQQENAKISDAFLAAIQEQGVTQEDIETASINVYEDYENPEETVMEHSYRITVRDVNRVGAVIDAALAAGANASYGLSFDVADRETEYIKALSQAMESVGTKAQTVAMAGGYTIVRPLSITETGADYGVMYADNTAMAADSTAQTTVVPQEIEITASVSGTYVID
ncbi:MAG: SIMPL domain-containing protein [Christensenella sp.]|nr:SIMPL domain-containing protein [Christensenella sp.]